MAVCTCSRLFSIAQASLLFNGFAARAMFGGLSVRLLVFTAWFQIVQVSKMKLARRVSQVCYIKLGVLY